MSFILKSCSVTPGTKVLYPRLRTQSKRLFCVFDITWLQRIPALVKKTNWFFHILIPSTNRKKQQLGDARNSELLSSTAGCKSNENSVWYCDVKYMIVYVLDEWILLFQLYVSVEFGRRWQLVHNNVVPNRFYWWDNQLMVWLKYTVVCMFFICLLFFWKKILS